MPDITVKEVEAARIKAVEAIRRCIKKELDAFRVRVGGQVTATAIGVVIKQSETSGEKPFGSLENVYFNWATIDS